MKALHTSLRLVVLFFVVILVTTAATASSCFPCITVDENGNGTIDLSSGGGGVMSMLYGVVSDPGPGGLASVLTYDMMNPPGLVIGDVVLHDESGALSDIIRFNPSDSGGYPFALVFYSDGTNGFTSLADTVTPPFTLYSNVVHIAEIGDAANSGAFYTPGPFDPGFIPGFSVQYAFISDGTGPVPALPEPSSLLLLAIGTIGIVAGSRKSSTQD